MTKQYTLRFVGALFSLLLTVPTAALALPDTFVQEGFVTDEEGRPYIGQYDITILLYTQARGGQPVFEELHRETTLFEGYYAVAVAVSMMASPPSFAAMQMVMAQSITKNCTHDKGR